MENPFSIIELQLSRLEILLVEVKEKTYPVAPPVSDELLTGSETASLLKVSKVTVWDWAKKGILTPYRIGNQVRYLKSEVIAAARPTKPVVKR